MSKYLGNLRYLWQGRWLYLYHPWVTNHSQSGIIPGQSTSTFMLYFQHFSYCQFLAFSIINQTQAKCIKCYVCCHLSDPEKLHGLSKSVMHKAFMKNLFVFNSYFCVQLFDSVSVSFKAVSVSLGNKQRKLYIPTDTFL